jgi:methionyl-tRNA synthetase
MDQIKYDEFAKVEFLIGEIKEAVEVEESDKLLRLQVDFGEEKLRTVFSGIKKWYLPADLIGKKTVFVTNIIPRKILLRTLASRINKSAKRGIKRVK